MVEQGNNRNLLQLVSRLDLVDHRSKHERRVDCREIPRRVVVLHELYKSEADKSVSRVYLFVRVLDGTGKRERRRGTYSMRLVPPMSTSNNQTRDNQHPASLLLSQHYQNRTPAPSSQLTLLARYLSLPGASTPFFSTTFGEYSFQSSSSIVYGGPPACFSPLGLGETTAATEEVITRRFRCGLCGAVPGGKAECQDMRDQVFT